MAKTASIQWGLENAYATATYEGSGSGPIVFTSDANEGLDRDTIAVVSDGVDDVYVVLKQEGKRERFDSSDGYFLVKEGGTLNVIKEKFQ